MSQQAHSQDSGPAVMPNDAARGRPRAASPPFLLLVALTSASPFALNAMTPALPRMADALAVPFAVIQLVLTVALLAFGLAQLVAGPLSDRFGRRSLVIAGLTVFAGGSLVSALSTSATVLIIGRALQAGGGATAFVLTRTIVYDTHERDAATAKISYMVMAMILAPLVGTLAGGYLVDYAGWRSIFWLIAAFGTALALLASIKLAETNAYLGTPRTLGRILLEARELLTLPEFWGYSGAAAFASGMFFAFLGVAPFIFEKIMGEPPSSFVNYFVLMSAGYMAGNFLSARLAARLGPVRMIGLGSVLAGIGIVLFWLMSGINQPIALFLPMMFVTCSNGLVLPSATVGAMALRPTLSGTASGVGGMLQMIVAALTTTVIGAFLSTTSLPMLTALTVCWLASILCLLLVARRARLDAA
ncbi:MAG: multidrug effflux MFS transporter [Hyphomicrobiaceae bacterium]